MSRSCLYIALVCCRAWLSFSVRACVCLCLCVGVGVGVWVGACEYVCVVVCGIAGLRNTRFRNVTVHLSEMG